MVVTSPPAHTTAIELEWSKWPIGGVTAVVAGMVANYCSSQQFPSSLYLLDCTY